MKLKRVHLKNFRAISDLSVEIGQHTVLVGANGVGKSCVSAFQISGGSGSSWRAFLVKEIADVSMTSETFSVRDGYNPHDSTMSSIIAAL